MIFKIKDIIFIFVKANLMFSLGVIFGSIVATITTIMITMGYLGVKDTIEIYQTLVCK
jgi:hypothetical protein